MIRKCGIDVGGVIIGGKTEKIDTFFTDDYLSTPPVDGAFDGVRRTVGLFGAENTFLVSKCGPETWRRSLEWMRIPQDAYGGQSFFAYTGLIDAGFYLRRCTYRPQKALIAQSIGLTDFVDDRRDVLACMEDIVQYRFLFGPQRFPVPLGMIPHPAWAGSLPYP